jgi:hypothetical protein
MVHQSRHSGFNGTLRIPLILLAVVLCAVVLGAGARPAWSDDLTIQSFFGEYLGRTLMPMGEARNRDLHVAIRPFGAFGFTVEWQTTLHKSAREPENKTQVIDFEPTRRPNVYAVARGDGTAGVSAPTGPADGEPYAWARIAGGTLTVNLLTIADNGDYVVQTYDRTLTPDGMKLDFMRVENGRIERQIKATLKRVGG